MGKPDLAWTSLGLTLLIAICALALGAHLGWERARRGSDLPTTDRKHFLVQDLRRSFGILLMALLAAGVYIGSRLPTRVYDPWQEAHPNSRFLAVWLLVFASVILLLGLAVIDWMSTRRYARRQREAMNRERIEILRDTLRHAQAADDGQANGSPFPST
jgi:lysylphosphatidylglycerol synthetase-like protein (DUF2156 family)